MLRVVFLRFSGHAAYGNAVKLSTEKGKQFVQGKDYYFIFIIFDTVQDFFFWLQRQRGAFRDVGVDFAFTVELLFQILY